MTRFITIFCFAFAALFTSSVNAQFADNFDSYGTGVDVHGTNGWKGWDNDASFSALTSATQALSAPNSIAIAPTSDLVNEMVNQTSGKWEFTVDQYIPNGHTGDTYFIMQNTYNDGGPYNWSIELLFSGTGGTGTEGMVTDDFDPGWAGVPYIVDQWVPIQVVIDLDADTVEQYYNGVLIPNTFGATGESWSLRSINGGGAGSGAQAIGAIDLFSNGGSTIFYDNVVLKQVVAADTMTVDRGNQTGGTLADTFDSDDSYVSFQPGLTLNAMEAPVRLIFDGTLPSDSPNSLDLVLESSAVTGGMFSTTLEAWNWNTPGWDVVDLSNASVGSDTVTTVDLTSDYVESGTGAVRCRVGWRLTGFAAQFPWEVQLDQLVWEVNQ